MKKAEVSQTKALAQAEALKQANKRLTGELEAANREQQLLERKLGEA
jgi:hypothetical protein